MKNCDLCNKQGHTHYRVKSIIHMDWILLYRMLKLFLKMINTPMEVQESQSIKLLANL